MEYLSKNPSIISILSRSECVLYFANSWLDRGLDHHPQYAIFLWCYQHIVDDVVVLHPLDFPAVLDASLITIENFSTALFCATCIFKYFDFVERSNLQTVTNEFLMDWNAVFFVENLKISSFCNTLISKLKFVCSPKLKSDFLRLKNEYWWTCSWK